MNSYTAKYLLAFIIFIFFNTINAQQFRMLSDFLGEDIIHFDYSYSISNNFAYTDSSIVLESLEGVKNVYIDSISSYDNYTEQIFLTIETLGINVKRTFFDTLSVDSVNSKIKDNIFITYNVNSSGGKYHIYGWIFPDTLINSVVDTSDTIPMYPYSKLYDIYEPENDDSLFLENDTLFIHYKPTTTNYFDSWFVVDYIIEKNHGLEYYSKNFGNYCGNIIRETYQKTGVSLISDLSTSKNVNSMYYLSQNYPNPFNPITRIKYEIPYRSQIEIVLYDILGKEITTLVNEIKNSGMYEVEFNGKNLSSGVYYYVLHFENSSITKKLLLLK